LYLLDTNVISETIKRAPAAEAMSFLRLNPETCISAITFHEIAFGLARMPDGRARRALDTWIAGLRETYLDRTIDVSEAVASRAGHLRAVALNHKQNLTIVDSIIASSAVQADAVLATRNVKDFVHCNVRVANPWTL
jgi:hypothetical protein